MFLGGRPTPPMGPKPACPRGPSMPLAGAGKSWVGFHGDAGDVWQMKTWGPGHLLQVTRAHCHRI